MWIRIPYLGLTTASHEALNVVAQPIDGRAPKGASPRGVDPDPIVQHGRRERSRSISGPGPLPSQGDVEQEVEGS
jgi:hypothetical protein